MALDQEVAFNFESVTVTTTSTAITYQVGDMHGFRAVISCEDQPVRFRYDGGAPTSTSGHLLNPGDRLTVEGRQNVERFRAIRDSTAAASAVLRVTLESI